MDTGTSETWLWWDCTEQQHSCRNCTCCGVM